MSWVIVIGYILALSVITIFSLEQLYLAILYRRGQTEAERNKTTIFFSSCNRTATNLQRKICSFSSDSISLSIGLSQRKTGNTSAG